MASMPQHWHLTYHLAYQLFQGPRPVQYRTMSAHQPAALRQNMPLADTTPKALQALLAQPYFSPSRALKLWHREPRNHVVGVALVQSRMARTQEHP